MNGKQPTERAKSSVPKQVVVGREWVQTHQSGMGHYRDVYGWGDDVKQIGRDGGAFLLVTHKSLSIARRLREHCKYDGHTPLVIMPEKVPEHLEGSDEKVNHLEWICYYEDLEQLKQLLARLLSSSE